MKDIIISNVISDMGKFINNYQLENLRQVLEHYFYNVSITEIEDIKEEKIDYSNLFLSSKKLEGCSNRTVEYYKKTVDDMVLQIDKNIKLIDTNDIRQYLSNYQNNHNCSNVTIDNIRRILSSFFFLL